MLCKFCHMLCKIFQILCNSYGARLQKYRALLAEPLRGACRLQLADATTFRKIAVTVIFPSESLFDCLHNERVESD